MTKVNLLPVQQLVSEQHLRSMEELIAAAREGAISNIVMVATTRTTGAAGEVTRIATFTDRLMLLGALEAAKDVVNDG